MKLKMLGAVMVVGMMVGCGANPVQPSVSIPTKVKVTIQANRQAFITVGGYADFTHPDNSLTFTLPQSEVPLVMSASSQGETKTGTVTPNVDTILYVYFGQ